MSEDSDFPEDALAANLRGRRASPDLLYPVVGLLVAALIALTSMVLIWRYVATRPLDLAPANAAMANHIEDLLAMSALSAGSVKRYAPISHSDDAARWNVHMFDVGVPPNLPVEDIVVTLKQGMALQDISIAASAAPLERERELRFSMLDREFAVVRLLGGAERYDLTAASAALAQNVKDLLGNAPHVLDVSSQALHDRQDGPIRWRTYALDAIVAPPAGSIDLYELLNEALGEFQGETPVVSVDDASYALEISLRNLPIIRLVLRGFPGLFAPPQEDFLEDPERIYQISPLFFRSLFGFDPMFSSTFSSANPSLPEDAGQVTQHSVQALESAPRAAIIVDDGGYGGLVSDAILAMDPRLTLAILPGTPFANETAERGVSRGFEVLVHMPLESGNPHAPYPGELTTAMAAAELEEWVAAALDNVPGAQGMNNHTGSKFTADEAAMKRFLSILKERGLFFVDSRTTAETVGECVARALGVPVASRSVFLDNDPEPEHILEQAAVLGEMALVDGAAIGICHFRHTTAAILPEVIRGLDARGVALVHVSELVR